MSRRLRLTVGALAAGALANAAILVDTPGGSLPFRPHDDDSLLHLVETEQRSLRLEHGFYLHLNSVAGDGALITDVEAIDPTFVDGLADMTLIARTAALPMPGIELDGLSGTLQATDGSTEIEYVIVPPPPGETRMHASIVDGRVVVVPESSTVAP